MKPISKLQVLIDRIPYAEGNLGEEAILTSLIQDLNACGVKDILVLSNQPERTEARHGDRVRVIPDEPLGWLFRPLNVSHCDLMIWGGGHMLQDRSSQLYIPYVVKTLLLAKLLKAPRFIYAPGIGPVVGKLGRHLSRIALGGSKYLLVRDDVSADFLRSIGFASSFIQTADPVFSLTTSADTAPVNPANDAPVVGIIPRRLFYRKGSWLPVSKQLSPNGAENPQFIAFLKETAAAADLLVEKMGARIRLIPTDYGPNPRDDLVCRVHRTHKRPFRFWS